MTPGEGGAEPRGDDLAGAEARARRAWADLVDTSMLRRGGGQLLVMDGPGDQAAICPLRPLTQVLAAAIEIDRLGAVSSAAGSKPATQRSRIRTRRPTPTAPSRSIELADTLERYRWGDGYVEFPGTDAVPIGDNVRLAIGALQAHAQLVPPVADSIWLHRAKRTFEVVASGAPDHRDAAIVELALRLHLATGIERYRSIAAEIDDRMGATSGASLDDADLAASVGSEVMWWKVTEDRAWLDRAIAGADALDPVVTDDRLWLRPPADNATVFDNLLSVHAVDARPRALAELDRYLERIWREARDPATGRFTSGDVGRTPDHGETLDHAAIVKLFALQASPPSA